MYDIYITPYQIIMKDFSVVLWIQYNSESIENTPPVQIMYTNRKPSNTRLSIYKYKHPTLKELLSIQ